MEIALLQLGLMAQVKDSQLKISQLRAFVAVATHANFSAAALELGLSQSTISHAIASLEAELEVVLLVRGRYGARLTAIGEQIMPEARQVLSLLESIQNKASLEKGLQSGQVRVGSVRSVATHVLPEVIARFRAKFPAMSVVLVEFDRYSEVEQSLREGRVEIGFTSLPTSDEFEVWELFRDEFVALLPPETLVSDAPLGWEQLTNHAMIVNHRSHQHNKVIREHLAQFGCVPKLDYEVREDSTLISMVKQGLGATVMARLAAEPIPQEIQVRSLPVPLERILGAAILADAILPKAVFVFLDVLKEVWQQAEFNH